MSRRKLLKAFYSEKKQQFDISKVPDIYDSAKYDAIHNSELGLDLKPLYTVRSQKPVTLTGCCSYLALRRHLQVSSASHVDCGSWLMHMFGDYTTVLQSLLLQGRAVHHQQFVLTA